MQKLENVDAIIGPTDLELKKQTLRYRRCILLAVVGGTPIETPSLARVVADGYLNSVKLWLDEILAMPEGTQCRLLSSAGNTPVSNDHLFLLIPDVGSVDLLLHLLSNVRHLPVTKSVVKDSGMGLAIGPLGKHTICKGTPNEAIIKERVQQIKDAWHASVKARKPPDAPKETVKRAAPELPSPSTAKRVKTEVEPKKSTSFTSLLKKVSGSPNGIVSSTSKSDSPTLPEKVVKPAVTAKPSSEIKENSVAEALTQTNDGTKKGMLPYFYW